MPARDTASILRDLVEDTVKNYSGSADSLEISEVSPKLAALAGITEMVAAIARGDLTDFDDYSVMGFCKGLANYLGSY